MLKYFKWFKRNAGKTRKSYNSNTGKGHTRVTQTTQKSPSLKISRSNNRNGTIRETTTWKRPDGFWTRKTRTVGSKPSPVRKPKFIKAKPFKAPKLRKIRKPKASRYYNSSRKSKPINLYIPEYEYDPEQERIDREKHCDRVFAVLNFILRPKGMPMPWYKRILGKILLPIVDTLVFLYDLAMFLLLQTLYLTMIGLGATIFILLVVWLLK